MTHEEGMAIFETALGNLDGLAAAVRSNEGRPAADVIAETIESNVAALRALVLPSGPEEAAHVRTDAVSGVEASGGGIPGGGGSADDYPSGGSPSGSEAPVSGPTDAAEADAGAVPDGEGSER